MSVRKLVLLLWVASVVESPALARRKPPCAPDLATCPADGCSLPGSTHAIVNRLKRNLIDVAHALPVSVTDLVQLQRSAGALVGENHEIPSALRAQLGSLHVDGRRLGEGHAVRLAGYIVGRPHSPGSGESVNCRLHGPDNNDLHFNIAATSDATAFSSVVAEMIPQHRRPGWTVAHLMDLAAARRQVLVVGQLLYDNGHEVNTDESAPLRNEPPRASLWEVHPVMELYLCARDKCSAATKDGWVAVQ